MRFQNGSPFWASSANIAIGTKPSRNVNICQDWRGLDSLTNVNIGQDWRGLDSLSDALR